MLSGMGTGGRRAVSKRKKRIYVGHVGDSRAYRVRKGGIVQLTRDHSLLNDYLAAMPDLTEEQQAEVPRNVITRALGMQDTVSVDLVSDDPQPGDAYLLCSDGLSGMLADQDILDIMSATRDPEEICRRLIEEANDQGGEDNITALVILFDEPKEEGDVVPSSNAIAPETRPAGTLVAPDSGAVKDAKDAEDVKSSKDVKSAKDAEDAKNVKDEETS